MKRLLQISLDTLLMSTLPIVMWIMLGIVIDKSITNVFTLTYPIQFLSSLLISIFGVGANVNATKNRNSYLVDSNIILGSIVGLILTVLLCINVDDYINLMSMDVETYKNYCIYSFILLYLQTVLRLICEKLYYLSQNKKSNILTIIFNIFNIILIVILQIFTNSQNMSIIITIMLDIIVIIYIFIKNVKKIKFKFEVIKNIKYVSNDILDNIGMFIIYFIGFINTLEFGPVYLVAINFETLICDAQWDMSYSIITAATIDASNGELNYRQSIKNAYKLVAMLILSSLTMGVILYTYYQPVLWIVLIFVGIQIIDLLALPDIWLRQQYCQINYSQKITTFHQGVSSLIRIIFSFVPTPFCTYIGQAFSMLYQILIFKILYRKKYYIENGLLKMRS